MTRSELVAKQNEVVRFEANRRLAILLLPFFWGGGGEERRRGQKQLRAAAFCVRCQTGSLLRKSIIIIIIYFPNVHNLFVSFHFSMPYLLT